MRISEVMSQKPESVDSTSSIREAAMHMRELDAGFVPITENDKIIGILTDRDIVVRGMANGKSLEDRVTSIETPKVFYCMEGDDVKDVLRNMEENHIQRLVVLNNENDKDFVGVVSLGDIACHSKDEETNKRIVACCRPYH